MKKKVLLICKNKKNLELLMDFLKKNGISSKGYQDLKEIMPINRAEISLSLIDLSGYDRSVLKVLSIFFEKKVPFIVIFPPQAKNKNIVPPPGSKGILIKPLNPKMLLTLVKNFLEEDR
ncbi:hypothetical protein [Desulfothermus sp.]